VIADCAHILNSPLPSLLAMPWDEVCKWAVEAARIHDIKRLEQDAGLWERSIPA
jgi:hypothetical protein